MAHPYYLSFLLLLLLTQWGTAQRVLLIEKINSAQTEKLYVGDYIQYRLVDEEGWQEGKIYELRDDQQLIAFQDRYLDLQKIEMMRFRRPWTGAIGAMLLTFGASWSGFAAIGTATDGDPNTRYQRSDAIVTGISMGLGLIVLQFGKRNVRFGEGRRNRLRIIDISF